MESPEVKKLDFGSFFFIVIQLLGFLSWNLETVTGNSPIDEDWRNAFGILVCAEICNCDGAGTGICDGAPSTCSSFGSIKILGTFWGIVRIGIRAFS